MGSEIHVVCRNCKYERRFTLGVGMLYSSLEIAEQIWNPELIDREF